MQSVEQQWKLRRELGIVFLSLDRTQKTTNTINEALLDELSAHIAEISADNTCQGIILASSKTNGFIAGADIERFLAFDTVEKACVFIEKGQQVFNQLAALTIPTVAMIKGFCLGGGLELALACRYRVAEEGPKTRLGLPEVLLGLHPGWGGTVRLPQLIGISNAMDLMLTGRSVDAKTAYVMGMVDACVPERHLEQAARYFILKKPAMHQAGFLQQCLSLSFARPFLANIFRKKVSQKVSINHYPAPFAIIKNWEQVGLNNPNLAFTTEANSLANIALSDTAQNLVRVFFLQERLKSEGKNSDFKAQHVHVIGAGTMGGDIAAWCALRGLRVTLQDRTPELIAPAIKRAFELFKKKLKTPRLVQAALDRLMPDPTGLGVSRADIVIEAVFENLEVKQKLFREIEKNSKKGAILATNTSSIPLDEINQALKNPERLVGIHFFNPVSMMQLVEVVRGIKTDEQYFLNALAFVRQIDRLPLPVKSSPGFLVNRVLMPYLMEAMKLLSENIAPEKIDQVATQFGMPMGPIQLADTVGLDVCLAVAKNLSAHLGGEIPVKLIAMVDHKKLGRKTGEGFYRYKNGKPIILPASSSMIMSDQIILQRLISSMVKEAYACLEEGIVQDGDLVDAGMIFGTGFAPFRGGPIHYSKGKQS